MAFVLQSEWSSAGVGPDDQGRSRSAIVRHPGMVGRFGSIVFTVLVHAVLLLILFTQLFSGKVVPAATTRGAASLMNVDLTEAADRPAPQSPTVPRPAPPTQEKPAESQPKVAPEWTTTTIAVPLAPAQPSAASAGSIAPAISASGRTTPAGGVSGGGRIYDPYAGSSILPDRAPAGGAPSEHPSAAEAQPPTAKLLAQFARAAATVGINDAIGLVARERRDLHGTVQLRLCVLEGGRIGHVDVVGGTVDRVALGMLESKLRQRFGSGAPGSCAMETASFPVSSL